MFEKILIATDGSETSEKAARVGVDIARMTGAKVLAVYIADTGRLSHLPDDMLLFSIRELLIKEGDEATGLIESLTKEAGIDFEKVVVEGTPSDEILRISKEAGVQLIVMGSVGRSGLDRFLLGSVAEKVVQHSLIPVMTVPGDRT